MVSTGRLAEIEVDIGMVIKCRQFDSKGKTVGNEILKAVGTGAAQRGPFIR